MDFIDDDVLCSDPLIPPNYSRNIQESSVFSWKITLEEFQSCQRHQNLWQRRLKSPKFPQDSDAIFKWKLRLYPYEHENDTEVRYSSIFLAMHESSKIGLRVHVKCQITLRTKNDKFHTVIDDYFALDEDNNFGDWEFMETEQLESQLRDGPAEILAFLSVNEQSSYRHKKKLDSLKSLSNDYLKILNNSTFSDVTICTKDNAQFKAHSNILAARSNVFAAMLTGEMMESRTKTITIEDFSNITISDLLNFIYGCKVQFRSIEETLDLLKISDKYELLDLKYQCLEYLSAVATKENASELFLIAEDYDLPELKKDLLEFLRKNKTKFTDSDFYSEILAKKPHLLIDITRHLAGDSENGTDSST